MKTCAYKTICIFFLKCQSSKHDGQNPNARNGSIALARRTGEGIKSYYLGA